MALAYLAADCQAVSCRLKKVVVSCVLPTQGLVSSGGSTATLVTDVSTAAGPRLWNGLPAGLRQTDIGYEQFNSDLFGR